MCEFSKGSSSRTVRSATALASVQVAPRRCGMRFPRAPKFLPRACGSHPAPLPTALVRLRLFPQAARAARCVLHLAKYFFAESTLLRLARCFQPRFFDGRHRLADRRFEQFVQRFAHRRLCGFLHPAPHPRLQVDPASAPNRPGLGTTSGEGIAASDCFASPFDSVCCCSSSNSACCGFGISTRTDDRAGPVAKAVSPFPRNPRSSGVSQSAGGVGTLQIFPGVSSSTPT